MADTYTYAIGRRKTATATVRLFKGNDKNTVNGKEVADFFSGEGVINAVKQPFALTNTEKNYFFTAKTVGGGVSGQAEALSLAIARALVKEDVANKPALKKAGLLTRDDRMVERKKTGQPKARKKPQFSKR